MTVTTTYTGTPQQLAEHLRELAEGDRRNAESETLPQKKRRWHAGKAAGLDLAASIVADFTPREEQDDTA